MNIELNQGRTFTEENQINAANQRRELLKERGLQSASASICRMPHKFSTRSSTQLLKRRERRAPSLHAAFTLIEIMIVVIIIGILAATIIPQFMGTTFDAKVSAAKGHIAELEAAIERFNVHMDRYPSAEEGLKVLTEPPAGEDSKWRGPYVKQLRNDPWGNVYQYRAPGTHHPSSFDLWSRGADNADGGEGQGADIGNW